jgi:hypothetical protein
MAEKSLVNEVALIEAGGELPPVVVPVVLLDVELLQAAKPSVIPKEAANRAVRFRERPMKFSSARPYLPSGYM